MLISDVQHWPNNTTRIQTWKVDTFLQVRSVHVRKKQKKKKKMHVNVRAGVQAVVSLPQTNTRAKQTDTQNALSELWELVGASRS